MVVLLYFITLNWSLGLFCRASEWMNACVHLCFLEQVIHHRKSEEFSHFLFLKYPRNVQYRPVSMATEAIGVWMCVCVWSGWTVIQHMSVWGSLWFYSLGLNTGTEYSWSRFTRWWYMFTDAVYKKKWHVPTNTTPFFVYYPFFACGFAVFSWM